LEGREFGFFGIDFGFFFRQFCDAFLPILLKRLLIANGLDLEGGESTGVERG